MKVVFFGIMIFLLPTTKYCSLDIVRKVEFIAYGNPTVLNNDFKINLLSKKGENIILTPKENNEILLPRLFSENDTFKVVFSYNKYTLSFNKVLGSELNYDSRWTFKVEKSPFPVEYSGLKISENVNEIFLWEFEPKDKDGWFIFEPVEPRL